MSLVEQRLAALARAVANLHPASEALQRIADDIAGLGLDDDTVTPIAPPSTYGGDDLNPWRQPQGAHDAYPKGAWVSYDGGAWVSVVADNVWAPGESGWRPAVAPGDDYPAWVQPTGSHDAYQQGDRVTHDGRNWESDIDSNVWEPPEQWTEV